MTHERTLDVLFTPADFERLPGRDLSEHTCVVFDVLRATSSMIVALANGAKAIHPVADIPEALALRRARPEVLLAGERHGVRIRGEQTGGVDFDLGNSPREFTPEAVSGRELVMTTTNGTRALRACSGAGRVFVGALLNLETLATRIAAIPSRHLLIVCSGTFEESALEDVLAAGALVDRLGADWRRGHFSDGARIARDLFRSCADDLEAALAASLNGRRLLQKPMLHDDVAFCARRDSVSLIAVQERNQVVRALPEAP